MGKGSEDRGRQRRIIHIDMDAFFASVEQRDNPELCGKPVIIGGLSGRGVVSTASYEARVFGVRSAMPMSKARRLCPDGVYLWPNMDKYQAVSVQLSEIFDRYSPLVEPLSLDEAFLDVSGMEWLYADSVEIARRIKADIRTELCLTASAGVAVNKFLAKLASDMKKPDGLVVIRPGQEEAILKNLPIRRLWGVGEVSAAALEKQGIRTAGQLAAMDVRRLEGLFGKQAHDWAALAGGIDERPVLSRQAPKSIGAEETFAEDLTRREDIDAELLGLVDRVGSRLRKQGIAGRSVTLKVRFGSFRTVTRSRTLDEATNIDDVIYDVVRELYRSLIVSEGIRLLGVSISQLQTGGSVSISLFDRTADKQAALYRAIDGLKAKFGDNIVQKARLVERSATKQFKYGEEGFDD